MSNRISFATAFEDTGVTLMNRVYGNSGAVITQAGLTAISFKCYQHDTKEDAINAAGGTLITSGTLVIADTVFDTLQTASPWDINKDATGYNFKYASPAADRTVGGKWHRYEIIFDPTTGADFAVVWVVESLPMAGS